MQLIRSRLRHGYDLRAGAFPIFRGVRARKDIEFANGVDAQQIPADAARRDRKLAGAGVFNSIQQEQVFQRPSSRNRECIALTRHRSRTLVCVIDRAWVQCDEIVEATAIQRQFLDLTFTHHTGHVRRCHIDDRRVR